MSVIAALRQMLAAGVPLEHALTAAEIMEAAPAPKSKGAERQRRWRDRLEASRETAETHGDAETERDADPLPLPPSPQTPQPPTPSPTEGHSRIREATPEHRAELAVLAEAMEAKGVGPKALAAEFERWWAVYPHKVGKADAARKFAIARRTASLAVLSAGVERYRQTKPPDREWCHPATWLHQGRWTDQPDHPPAPRLVHDRTGPHPTRTAPPTRAEARDAVWSRLAAEEDLARTGGRP